MSGKPNPLAPELRAFLDGGSQAPPPNRGAQDRVFARLTATIVSGDGATHRPPEPAVGQNPLNLTHVASLAAKVLTPVALISAVWISAASRSEPDALSELPSANVRPAFSLQATAAMPPRKVRPPSHPTVLNQQAEDQGGAPVIPTSFADDGLAAERALLFSARRALENRSLVAARVALKHHRRDFPAGRLEEEREALWIHLLIAEGDPQAVSAARAFGAHYPNSILWPAIAAALPAAP